MLLTVRFSMLLPGRKQRVDAKAQKTPADADKAARPPAERVPSVEKAWGSEEGDVQDTSPSHQHDQLEQQPSGAGAAVPARADTGEVVHPVHPTKERSKSLDVTKVRHVAALCSYWHKLSIV
jgi:hypothetical protein